jgi:hypothetical protein
VARAWRDLAKTSERSTIRHIPTAIQRAAFCARVMFSKNDMLHFVV